MWMNKDAFFERMAWLGLALTYGDVEFKTGYTEVHPNNVNLAAKFSRSTLLKIPIVSAAMDKVTGHEMAICMAKLGGIGVIHRSMIPEDQALEVARVKYYMNGVIDKPICVRLDDTVEQVLRMKEEKQFKFSSFPVIDNDGKVVAVVSKNDFEFCDKASLRISEIISRELIAGDESIQKEEAYKLMKEKRLKVLPLLDRNGRITKMYAFKDLKRIITGQSSKYNLDENDQLRVAAAIGIGAGEYERVEKLVRKRVDALKIDSAHADSKDCIDMLTWCTNTYPKKDYPWLAFLIGNISEPESAERLCQAGADGIIVGQGPGSICTTRKVAGYGCPQVTAIYECSRVADKFGVPVCADGGIEYSGDIAKALAAGAWSVMMGSLLAGTDESPGKKILYEGRYVKDYRGMGSIEAMEESEACRQRYMQTGAEPRKLIAEGVTGVVDYAGPAEGVILQYTGGLRSGMAAAGAENIEFFRKHAKFHRDTPAGQQEAHPRIIMTKDAPNYSMKSQI